MKTFTKWIVVNSIIFTSLIISAIGGLFTSILQHDATYAVLICLFLYTVFSLYLGKVAYLIDKNPDDNDSHLHKLQPVYFMADNFLYIGLFLTTSGLFYTIVHALPLAQNGDTAEFIKQLMNGVGRTLLSTVSALCGTILLSIQLFIVSRNLKDSK